jgi:CRISPR system Cascade subunit CasE
MLDDAADRSMPQNFSVGTRFGFQVRIRPISRMGRPIPGHPSALERGNRTRERDVYLARVEAAERISVGAGEDASASVPSRATCYLEWLDARLNDMGASIERMSGAEDTPTFAARLDAFRFTRLRTRDRSKEATQSRAVDGPDATVTGTLVITDPEAFATGLVRGIGRFRAFGFGMLLLSPPRKG